MRSAPALSALLLLLLLPPPTLSQDEDSQGIIQSSTTQSSTTQSSTTQSPTTQSPTTQSPTTQSTQSTTLEAKTQTTTNKTQATTLEATIPMTTAKKTNPEITQATDNQTGTQRTPEATTRTTTANTAEVESTGPGTTPAPSIQPLPTEVTVKPSLPTDITNTISAPPSATTSSGAQPSTLGPVTSKSLGSSPEGPKCMPTASRSSGSTADRTVPSQGTPATLAPLSTPQGRQQTSSIEMPAIAGTTASGPAATTPVISPNIQVKCQPPEMLNKNMLILNVTETRLCESPPPDDKLVTLLCQTAKPTFNRNQDQCHIQLVPDVLGSHAVAIKEISIQTNLLPSDIYKSLKDKWDEVMAVGVSGMQFGDHGTPEETEDRFSMPLIITIVCMASFLLLVAALYGCCHQRLSQRKDQQRLTEELQTVENGYHDNPTLEVMETSSDMQEKKVVNLNGELGDSWIVPLDNLTKDDFDEEEDTHL